ncbi:sugar transferase [Phaeobacter sp. B1627]|uniref:sugar transferase n=1 Tax=Phaeobacter sp. B1627 TaxID=2583809 RepID=UPI0011192FAC|nr:sugar transferase [Phaeobacter sp. B1627]TNJ40978.1 sugar transferase [Phaeobacter sp. B1627]
MVVQLHNSTHVLSLDYDRNKTGERKSLYGVFGKRILDILLTVAAAPLVVLLLVPMIVCVALDGGNPFYSQMRVGRGGRSYRMWKLRTMVVGADEKLSTYLAENPKAKEEWDLTQKLKSDPRITKVGKFLRKTSVDELPQLWNVLLGDMSLIGPRPMMISQKELYPGTDYYELRPGITGSWQVSSRNESSFADRARFDARYNEELSLRSDLNILFKTVKVVCKATGH